jgi:hypothetical protein
MARDNGSGSKDHGQQERRPKPLYFPGDDEWTRWYLTKEAAAILAKTSAALRGWVRRHGKKQTRFVHEGIEARKLSGKWMFRFDRSWRPGTV